MPLTPTVMFEFPVALMTLLFAVTESALSAAREPLTNEAAVTESTPATPPDNVTTNSSEPLVRLVARKTVPPASIDVLRKSDAIETDVTSAPIEISLSVSESFSLVPIDQSLSVVPAVTEA